MFPDLLIHIRHGETDWNAARRLQGSRDIPLNDTGRAQAARNGQRLQQLLADLGHDPDAMDWVSSPMGRTRETMEIVRRAAGLDPSGYRIEEGLRELSFGRLEGLTYEEMEIQEPALYLRLKQDKWTFEPPGGESYVALAERVAAAIATIRRFPRCSCRRIGFSSADRVEKSGCEPGPVLPFDQGNRMSESISAFVPPLAREGF
jgi:probable phosphoglycerate mutase